MTRHILPGLRSEPLASYLAGLGLIRVLGEQADPELTAAWSDGGLVVQTTVDDIATWLAERYVPTPVLSPWNEGSGFGAKDKAPKDALASLAANASPRLDAFRAANAAADFVGMTYRSGVGWTKERAVREFRNRCPESVLAWIDAAVVLAGDQTLFPPLLGTGGNDGRLDFSTNFHQRLLELLDVAPGAPKRSEALARDLLTGTQVERLSPGAVGQFDPAGAGGPNSSPFGASDSLVNPWGFVLLVEGALLFASTAVRRHQHGAGRAAMPFTSLPSAEGSASGARGETSRGELWTPLWDKPFTLAEVRQLFAEARASWRGRPAQRAVEFYAATRTLGVSRGIAAFTRYGLHQRNGLAFAAVPVERVVVTNHPEVALAARLEEWVSWARRGEASTAVSQQVRRFDAAHLTFARDGGPLALGHLLAAVTDLEMAVGRSGRARAAVQARRPPPAEDFLRWLRSVECPELRVAAGIASCRTIGGVSPARTMRQILLPVDPGTPKPEWRDTPLVAGLGMRPLRAVLADVLMWRARTATNEQAGSEAPATLGALTFRRGMLVPDADAHAFATSGYLDDERIDLWLRACLALDWGRVRHSWADAGPPARPVPLLGLLHPFAGGLTPEGSDSDTPRVGLGPDWPARLKGGQLRGVHNDAVRRLRQAGWQAAAAPESRATDNAGIYIAAALVPRCQKPQRVLRRHLATPLVADDDATNEPEEMS